MMEYHKEVGHGYNEVSEGYNCHKEVDQHQYNRSCLYCHNEDIEEGFKVTEEDYSKPFQYNYLLNLMIAPDMNAYLSLNDDDLFNLPIHLQKLIIEAKEELVLLNDKDKPAQNKLERLKNSICQRANGDLSILMSILSELVFDEDELEDLLRLY